MPSYNPKTIEKKWQRHWADNATFRAERLPKSEKLYVLDMFPYPSGDGLHVGHPEGYTATDIYCRYHRMRGKSVIHPMGWDAFGLPAEQHAKKTGTHPRITTEKNIANFRRQLQRIGFSYDWDREIATTDPDYFRWTQWIFLLLFDTWYDPVAGKGRPIEELPIPETVQKQGSAAVNSYRDEHRLAYQQEALVNWCPALGTVLANEEVNNGRSERGDHPVSRIPLRQWMLRITAYADRLESDLESVDWPESVKKLQRDWIGRSTGAEVDFGISKDPGEPTSECWESIRNARSATGFPNKPQDDVLRIYTTRPDTLFGATYMVIAPEHPYVKRLTTAEQRQQVEAYCQTASFKSDLDRTDLAKEKTGVFTGSYAINPVNHKAIPIWVADYVLMGYGTGAIMAVPAHDTRDFEFAVEFNLDIVAVVDPAAAVEPSERAKILRGEVPFTGTGTVINSNSYDALGTREFKQKIVADLHASGLGSEAVNYKLRDWLFSRQHFWGEPFPILHELDDAGNEVGAIRALGVDELPLDLPDMPDFEPHHTPEPPLEQAPKEWLYLTVDGTPYKRETNTMPQWAGSCWYYLRFLDPKNDQAFIDPEIEKAWMPVDLYIGGAEHAVLHLLYSRFWHKVLFDRGWVSCAEPFQKLVNQGMILGEVEFTGYQTPDGSWFSSTNVATGTPPANRDDAELKRVKVSQEQTEKKGDSFYLKGEADVKLESRAYKMSKSRGNVVNPDEVIDEYGADSLRLYEMFMGPLEAAKPWNMQGVEGINRFLRKSWRTVIDDRAEDLVLHQAVGPFEPNQEQLRVTHKTIQAVTEDLEKLRFNTAIARLMEFVNFFAGQPQRPKTCLESFVLLLCPMAPHIAEELWQALGNSESLAYHPWPKFDESYIRESTIQVPVQVNGKLRGRLEVPVDLDRTGLEAAALEDEKIASILQGKKPKKVIVVPGRLVNVVI